jgi:UPF0716 family protein affecting phage T7 exclusion
MDDALLAERLGRVERRLNLLLVLVAVPYFVGLAELVGYALAGVLTVLVAVLGFLSLTVSRRGDRTASEP